MMIDIWINFEALSIIQQNSDLFLHGVDIVHFLSGYRQEIQSIVMLLYHSILTVNCIESTL